MDDVKQLMNVGVSEWAEDASSTVGLDVPGVLADVFSVANTLLTKYDASDLRRNFLTMLPELQLHAAKVTPYLAHKNPLLDGPLLDSLEELVLKYIKIHTDTRVNEGWASFVDPAGTLGRTTFDTTRHYPDIGGMALSNGDPCFVVFPGMKYIDNSSTERHVRMYVLGIEGEEKGEGKVESVTSMDLTIMKGIADSGIVNRGQKPIAGLYLKGGDLRPCENLPATSREYFMQENFGECGLAKVRFDRGNPGSPWGQEDYVGQKDNVVFWKVHPDTSEEGKIHYPPTAKDLNNAIDAATVGVDYARIDFQNPD